MPVNRQEEVRDKKLIGSSQINLKKLAKALARYEAKLKAHAQLCKVRICLYNNHLYGGIGGTTLHTYIQCTMKCAIWALSRSYQQNQPVGKWNKRMSTSS